MLSPINRGKETVKVNSFLAIRDGNFSVSNVTAIIGPQASGKSIFAKLIYFGRSYIRQYLDLVFLGAFDKREFKIEQAKRFVELFGGLVGFDSAFSIQYAYGDFIVTINRVSERHKPKVTHNDSLEKLGGLVKKEFTRFSDRLKQQDRGRARSNLQYVFTRQSEEAKAFFASIPKVLFVPASRSFYASVSEELFTFLASDERIDPLIAQFGSFYEFAKRNVAGEWYGVSRTQSEKNEINKKIRPVIDGDFVRIKSNDFIKTKWGRVPLRSSSSGQQEALPLLFSLMEYPGSIDGPHLIIIEEPEAHLFPTAQKYVLDLIVERVTLTECEALFTSHSPYVLSCLNNHVMRFRAGKNETHREIQVGAWLAQDGTMRNIIDEETGLIDTNALDEISEVIASEFIEAIG